MAIFRRKGFTLIELLIVVAIIAILAAIAVPNFLEAQVRAKVSRCKNDMRSLTTGLEAYKVDSNHYPPDGLYYNAGTIGGGVPQWLPLHCLTTPVAYTTSVPPDLFANTRLKGADLFRKSQLGYSGEETLAGWLGFPYNTVEGPKTPTGPNLWVVYSGGRDVGKLWALASIGPDRWDSWGTYAVFGGDEVVNRLPALPALGQTRPGAIYDSTNGSLSDGDIVRTGP